MTHQPRLPRRLAAATLAVAATAAVGLGLLTSSPAAAATHRPSVRTTTGTSHEVAPQSDIAARCDNGTRIRTGPATNRTVVGLCYANHSVTVHYAVDTGQAWFWYYLTDNTTHKSGYSYGKYVTLLV